MEKSGAKHFCGIPVANYEIKTKFWLGDKLWFVDINGELREGVVGSIHQSPGNEFYEFIGYSMKHNHNLHGDKIFRTKQELINSL